MQISCIYAITHIASGKQYIGSTKDYNNRLYVHLYHLRKDTHHNMLLQRSFNKHGEEAFQFEILEEVLPENLLEDEQWWIDQRKPVFNYSMTANRHALGLKRSPFSEEHRANLSASHKGKNLGPCSEETKAKIRAKLIGKKRAPHSEEAKIKIAAAQKGKQLSDEHKLKLSAARIKSAQSKETKNPTRDAIIKWLRSQK